jgi:soluble lytic murein transglycosylase-like protein
MVAGLLPAVVRHFMVNEARVTKAYRISRPVLLVLVFPFFLGTPSITRAFCFEEAGRQYGVNPQLLHSIAMVESRLHPEAVHRNDNGSIDSGLMQINSAWNDRLGLNQNQLLHDPCYNVMTGAKILRQCIDRYGYTWEAVGCYNATSNDKRVAYSWKIQEICRENYFPGRKSQDSQQGSNRCGE